MKNPNSNPTGTPPRLIPTLIKGFNTIANHWYLILFPFILDTLLWLGPKISIKTIFSGLVTLMKDYMQQATPASMQTTLQASKPLLDQLLNQFNLATALRTLPIGVPSLMARELSMKSPLGTGLVYDLPSIQWFFAVLGLLSLVGFFLGSIYFLLVAQVTSPSEEKISWKDLISSYGQSLVMFCLLIILLVLISFPLSLILSVLTVINAGIGQFFVILCFCILLWLLIPLVFAPHGIFVLKQKALPSMLISVRLVRLFLPGTGLFIMTSILISEGMNMLWTLPEATSWMTLLGIGGHAFVITGLLAASFIYYREGLRWMQENLQRMAEATRKQQENGGTSLEQQ
jgi:hypothetical protein